jgi:NADH dehydrogenase
MKHIVIIGGGFGGISAAKNLAKFLHPGDAKVTLINKDPYHSFHANLYEIATSPEELTTNLELKKTVSIPLADILPKNVELIIASVTKIDHQSNKLETADGLTISFDYLIQSTGSKPCYFGIPGTEAFSSPLKSVYDALKIRSGLESMIELHRTDIKKPYVNLVIIGGGIAGVEFAAESIRLFNWLSFKYSYPRFKIQTLIIEAKNDLASGLDKKVGDIILSRLLSLGTRIKLNTKVTKVDSQYLDLENGEKIEYDFLVWTGGISANSELCSNSPNIGSQGRVMVSPYLELPKSHNIFLIGDLACIADKNNQFVPANATNAIDQGKYIASLIRDLIKNREPSAYKPKDSGFSIPIGGKWAVVVWKGFIITGFPGYVIRQLELLRYFIYLVGWLKGTKLFLSGLKLYSRND